jgi:hypothetical protein
MPMEDLAAFTRHMALNDPEANWIPMTTATVRYAHKAKEQIQPVGTQPPVLQPRKSFGVSYEAQDDLGATIRGSVMLRYDGTQYSVIDPRSSRRINSLFNEPEDALKWFMREINSEHPNFQEGMTFTVLYHVPPAAPSNNAYRARIDEARGSADTLEEIWLDDAGSIAEARQQVAEACKSFEEENSRLLTINASLVVGDKGPIASQVRENLKHIELLGRVYSSMTKTEMEFDLIYAED